MRLMRLVERPHDLKLTVPSRSRHRPAPDAAPSPPRRPVRRWPSTAQRCPASVPRRPCRAGRAPIRPAAAVATISTSTSALAVASLMVAGALTPSPARTAAFCGSMSKAVTACPALPGLRTDLHRRPAGTSWPPLARTNSARCGPPPASRIRGTTRPVTSSKLSPPGPSTPHPKERSTPSAITAQFVATLEGTYSHASSVFSALQAIGIDLTDVFAVLEAEGQELGRLEAADH